MALKNRGRGEIIALILDVATQGTNKTKIMYSAYLSSAQLKDYLTFLQASGLVRQERGGESYKTTEKGRRYLQKYRELDEMIESEVSKVDQRRA
ncbi:MAG TPA: winged helix-turn-helix domain-containing protein [Candidatus Nitrosotalea sp.]|nr:winged helix-turn-helix domain-containing protein [Candidatus Nitrosotalea sp.]